MKYYYLTADIKKIYTSKEMYDSQVQYEIEKDAFFDAGGTLEKFGEEAVFSEFALAHCYQCPVDADLPEVYVEEV